jgi:hypothetical protein
MSFPRGVLAGASAFASGDSLGLVLALGGSAPSPTPLGAFLEASLRDGTVSRTRLVAGVCGPGAAVGYDAEQGCLWVLHAKRGSAPVAAAAAGAGAGAGAGGGARPNEASPAPSGSPFGSTDRAGLGASPGPAAAAARPNGVARVTLVRGHTTCSPWWRRQGVAGVELGGEGDAAGGAAAAAAAELPLSASGGVGLARAGSLIPSRGFCMVCAFQGVDQRHHCLAAAAQASAAASGEGTREAPAADAFLASVFSFGASGPPSAATVTAPAVALKEVRTARPCARSRSACCCI